MSNRVIHVKIHAADPVDGAAVNAFVCTVQAESYDSVHDRVFHAGGSVALPKQTIPGMAWQGHHEDSEGNGFGVHPPDPGAR